jgi:hypothetical protein
VEILEFLKEYWTVIVFFVGEVGVLFGVLKTIKKALQCTLRNDILDIYDRCKEKKKITRYQLQSIHYSYKQYQKLKGNSFVADIVEIVGGFELID